MSTSLTDPRSGAQSASQQRPFSQSAIDERDQKHYQPRTGSDSGDAPVYILTLLTDVAHHASMHKLRQAYFPPKLNKLEAHITLFHALPEEKLEREVVPAIEEMVSRTRLYRIQVNDAFRLSKGVGLAVADDIDYATKGRDGRGRNMTRIIHAELRKKWSDWLSEQDSKPPRLHYTIANKINKDDIIAKNLEEVSSILDQAKSSSNKKNSEAINDRQSSEASGTQANKIEGRDLKLLGEVQGLTLWKYMETGHWAEPRNFEFTGRAHR